MGFKIVLRQRLDFSIGADGLDQILYLAFGNTHPQLLASKLANTEKDENKNDGGGDPYRTATDSFVSCLCHSTEPGRSRSLLPLMIRIAVKYARPSI